MFECHITCNLKDEVVCEQIASQCHWKTSKIDGDPVLGKKAFFYFTSHDTDLSRMMVRMNNVCNTLRARGIPVLREKIEVIIYDRKEATT